MGAEQQGLSVVASKPRECQKVGKFLTSEPEKVLLAVVDERIGVVTELKSHCYICIEILNSF